MTLLIYACAFFLTLAALGQQPGKAVVPQGKTASSAKPDPSAPAGNLALQKHLEALEKEVKDLKETLDIIQNYTFEHIGALEHGSATFDPTSPGPYVRVDSSVGPLLVSLGKVEQYLDGYSVHVEIGNPSAASLKGFKIQAVWAKRYKKEDGNYFDWYKGRKQKEFSFTGTLASGNWNGIQLILPDTKPSEFGYLQITIDTDTVSMGKSTVAQ